MSLADEAAQFNSPVEHALAVLKIIGVSEHEDFGDKLGAKLVEDNVRSVQAKFASVIDHAEGSAMPENSG